MSDYFNLFEYGLIRVSGNDAEKFLQGQLTCDVRDVNLQQSRLGAHCDPKGRIQVCFRLFKYQNDYYLRLLKTLIPHTLSLLQKYAVFSKVTLEDVSSDWLVIGVYGKNSYSFFEETPPVDGIFLSNQKIFIRTLDEQLRFEIIGSKDEMHHFQKHLSSLFSPADFEQWKLLDIRAGIATVFAETCGLFTPHDINYPQINAVSFSKGCYTGQEIIARMQFLGKLKQHTYRVQFMNDNAPAPGSLLADENGNQIGILVECAQAEDRKFEALAFLQDKAVINPILLKKTILEILDLPYTL